uniref:Uncharacterized 3.3 kDa protein in psbT-psbN intergenic region n=2 Tax=Marchantia TaxID=3196 RepID=YCX2_MARPO|nr:hypothetical protein MapoCp058 [Marchantia paleacea]Q32620.1 RecName: Full=Uncharacterized 3.3 kDa protein in psbT-psbN intergenic region; AltName: Full=ORF27 [Marchantia polymorpha]BAS44748.1 hypothetical protein [Marchantia paleacea subsp. diptera]CAA28112.1 unnamed protein product [Marchantia paleacea]
MFFKWISKFIRRLSKCGIKSITSKAYK